MDPAIARWIKDGSPTVEERELAARVAQCVRTLRSDHAEAERSPVKEHTSMPSTPNPSPAFAETERWIEEMHSLDTIQRRSMEKSGPAPEGFTYFVTPPEFAPFRRLTSAVDELLRCGRDWIEVRGIGFASPCAEDAERCRLWSLRAVYVYWLISDPSSEWSGGPYSGELVADRASVFEFLDPARRKELAQLVECALERIAPPTLAEIQARIAQRRTSLEERAAEELWDIVGRDDPLGISAWRKKYTVPLLFMRVCEEAITPVAYPSTAPDIAAAEMKGVPTAAGEAKGADGASASEGAPKGKPGDEECRTEDTDLESSEVTIAFQLDPTDESILDLLEAHPGERMMTPEIAEALGRSEKSIGKNLSDLGKAKLIENKPRKGYLRTKKARPGTAV